MTSRRRDRVATPSVWMWCGRPRTKALTPNSTTQGATMTSRRVNRTSRRLRVLRKRPDYRCRETSSDFGLSQNSGGSVSKIQNYAGHESQDDHEKTLL